MSPTDTVDAKARDDRPCRSMRAITDPLLRAIAGTRLRPLVRAS